MSFLLDTNVVSEATKPRPNPNVHSWLASVALEDLFLSILVIGEIRSGVERLRARTPQPAVTYEAWLGSLRTDYVGRILPVTESIAEEWGRLNAFRTLPVVDGLLAATARVLDMTLVTRNTRDVAATGVSLLNPFEPQS